MSPRTIPIAIAPDAADRGYDAVIGAGLLDEAGALIAPLLARPRTVVVTDETVAAAQGPRLTAALDKAGIAHETIVLPAGEATKSFHRLEALIEALLLKGIERDDAVIAFGGGVIGDLVGLAAGLVRRGCAFIQIPTTLLAQVDSSVGGKTAINARSGKNLIGLFHQPRLVIADTSVLRTLALRERRAGYAEIVNYAAIGDRPFFDWLEADGAAVLEGDATALAHAVATSIAAKAAIVAADEREKGARALLNLGHTFGHALEAAFGYDGRLLHGEAVAAGMALAFDYAVAVGLCPDEEARRFKAHLSAAGLPDDLPAAPDGGGWRAASLIESMMQDKKVKDGRITLILPHRIGDARISPDASTERLATFFRARGAQ